uniref:Uncharacterized protein n=1 Tax=Siphoviridae sp. ctnpt50 TaxID=2827941 RepID=A0A8S5SDS1_9CAUD|nr:MAG TPA: hypothetical protein [Siphoviridae sp. ctnpt50]
MDMRKREDYEPPAPILAGENRSTARASGIRSG